MQDVSYKAKIRGMVMDLLPEIIPDETDQDLEHALDVCTTSQAGNMYRMCMNNEANELREFIKDLQRYQVRKEV